MKMKIKTQPGCVRQLIEDIKGKKALSSQLHWFHQICPIQVDVVFARLHGKVHSKIGTNAPLVNCGLARTALVQTHARIANVCY